MCATSGRDVETSSRKSRRWSGLRTATCTRKSCGPVTKYLGGHGDVIAGVVACDTAWATLLRQVRVVTGALLHPLGGCLLRRGLQTLP